MQMMDMKVFSGLTQNGSVGALALEPGALTGQSAPSGSSGLKELAAMLAEMLLGASSGKDASASGQSAGDDLLHKLQGAGASTQGKDGQPAVDGSGGDSAKELLTQVLMALFEKLLGGDSAQGGDSTQGKGVGGTQGVGGSANPEDLVNTLMKSLGDGSLNSAISPTADGGGQVSGDERLKAVLEMIAQFMDSHPQTFGTPHGGGDTTSNKGSQPVASNNALAPVPDSSLSPEEGAPATELPTLDNSGAAPVSFPTASSNPTVVNSTIKVGPGEVFDGGGKTFTAGAALGDGGQGESQKPLFELAEGATLKNVVIGDNGADGVHVKSAGEQAVNVDNVHWTNVGEDALTVKDGGAKVTNLNITNSSAQGAADKIFQLNADANVNVDNFKAKDFGTFMRTNGGQQGNWNLNLSNVSAENGKFSFVKSDSEGLNLTTHNIDLNNVQNAYSKLPESTRHQEV
ncbi:MULTISPECIES: pectate lyase [unclassified Pseudomonas]|uniref:pectate lyase n=2 Tax=Pseudomonas TaxID=286 RepID=UPI0030D9E787